MITAMHAHMAFFGAYVMIVLAMITYATPQYFHHPDERRETPAAMWAFWLQVAGMFGMTMALAAAGITQTYLERILGLGYLDTQKKMQVHYLMLVGTGILFVLGVALYLYDFFVLAPRRDRAAPWPSEGRAGVGSTEA
jgi:nitric oxide reductase subunit B